MQKFIGLCFALFSIGLACAGAQPAQASTAVVLQSVRVFWETAPLPPPTPIRNNDGTLVVRLDDPFTLPLHQWATLTDTPEQFSIQLTSVASDSRCPAQVNCIVAGQAEFMLLLRTGNVVSPRQFTIGSYPTEDQNKVRYAGYEIELTDVQPPAPPPDQTLQPSDYQVTFIVRHDGAATPEPTATPTAIPAPQDDSGTDQTAILNRPFTLRAGETADLRDVGFQVTLRSVTEESGCLTESDCSLMLAEGTLVLQQGDQREVLTFNVSFSPEQPFAYDFSGYVVQLVHLEKRRDGHQVATFVVKKPTPMVEIPAPQRVERCPTFSRFDAAAILQEDVQQEAIANLIFGPLPIDATAAAGLCGYVTTAFSDARPIDEQAPMLLSEVAADRAVIAATIEGSDITRLLQVANLVVAAQADADPDLLLRLQAQLTAGDTAELISDLTALAAASPAFTVTPLQDVGDEGVWLWQQRADGAFALLLIRVEDRFQVVMALLNQEAEADTVRDYALVVAGRQAQGTINEAPPTPQSPADGPTIDCDLITVDDAAAILGEAVHEPVAVAGEDGSCLYIPSSEAALTPEEAAVTQSEHGVLTQFITGAKVADQLTSLAEEIKRDNPNADEDIFNIIQSQLSAGDTEGALALLPTLAAGAEHWRVEAVDDLAHAAIFLWFTEVDHTYSALLTTSRAGALKLLMAGLPPDRKQDEVRAALITAASGWAE